MSVANDDAGEGRALKKPSDRLELNPAKNLQQKIRIESLIILVLLGVLGFGALQFVEMAKRVEYQPVAYAAGSMHGMANPDEFPHDTIVLFVRNYLNERYNFSMITAEEKFRNIEPMLSPKKLLASRDRLDVTLKQIQSLRMFSHHENLGEAKIADIPGQKAYTVEQKALARIYHGDYPTLEEIRFYTVTVLRESPSPSNPMGLYVYADPYEKDSDRRAKSLDVNMLDAKAKQRLEDQREANAQARERQIQNILKNSEGAK